MHDPYLATVLGYKSGAHLAAADLAAEPVLDQAALLAADLDTLSAAISDVAYWLAEARSRAPRWARIEPMIDTPLEHATAALRDAHRTCEQCRATIDDARIDLARTARKAAA